MCTIYEGEEKIISTHYLLVKSFSFRETLENAQNFFFPVTILMVFNFHSKLQQNQITIDEGFTGKLQQNESIFFILLVDGTLQEII